MRRLLAVALSTPLALAVATPAAAEGHGPPPIAACGGELTVETIKDTTRFKERPFGFQVTGNAVVRLSDGNSSVDIRVPGRLLITDDPGTGIRTIVLTGQNLIIAETEGQRAALAEAGLPEVGVIKGRVVLTEEFDPETGATIPGTERVVSSTPDVTDVCDLLDG